MDVVARQVLLSVNLIVVQFSMDVDRFCPTTCAFSILDFGFLFVRVDGVQINHAWWSHLTIHY